MASQKLFESSAAPSKGGRYAQIRRRLQRGESQRVLAARLGRLSAHVHMRPKWVVHARLYSGHTKGGMRFVGKLLTRRTLIPAQVYPVSLMYGPRSLCDLSLVELAEPIRL